MNTTSPPERTELQLVDIVDLKWMLAGQGMRVHVERLQSDTVYARECLLEAERSGNSTLRQLAAALRARLDASAQKDTLLSSAHRP